VNPRREPTCNKPLDLTLSDFVIDKLGANLCCDMVAMVQLNPPFPEE
jgi:hypothetical protein